MFNKLVSKKFFGFLTACYFFNIGKLSEQMFILVLFAYMGVESIINLSDKYLRSKETK